LLGHDKESYLIGDPYHRYALWLQRNEAFNKILAAASPLAQGSSTNMPIELLLAGPRAPQPRQIA
jgi:hypothetical protein